jgi:glycosyltransferase involved in cell wall biosynthesis
MPPLKIGFLTQHDPHDRSSWSGGIFYMFSALKDHAGEVEVISSNRSLLVKLISKANHYIGRIFRAEFAMSQSVPLSMAYGKQFTPHVDPAKYDVIFAPLASNEVAYLRTNVPIVYMSDATFSALENYYFSVDKVSKLYLMQGNHLESRAIQQSSALVYCSNWAADSARKDYGAANGKVHTVPLGANIDAPPTRDSLKAGSTDGKCRLLFVGRDWQRKGGQIACDAFFALRAMGVDAQLTIVGCQPPTPIDDPNLIVIPFLNKKVEADRTRLEELYYTSDFFLLPTRAECFGMVFCEANAYGLPIVSTATGGVSTIVQEGINGYLLKPEAGGEEYARVIEAVWKDQPKYHALRTSTRDRYDQVLNWKSWAESIRQIMESVVQRKAI